MYSLCVYLLWAATNYKIIINFTHEKVCHEISPKLWYMTLHECTVMFYYNVSNFLYYVTIDLFVGITSAIVTTSPYYALDICVSVTNGVLQHDITVVVNLITAIQSKL